MEESHPSEVLVDAAHASADRWKWTRRLSRLGTVGAIVLGASIAFDVGGSWNAELLAWLFGLPFSIPLAWTEALYPSAQGGPAAAWSWVHLALGASAIASWTAIGAIIDVVRARRRPSAPSRVPPAASEDRFLREAQADVDAILRGEERARQRESRGGPSAFLRVARVLANASW